jgi:histidine triad (HIT) family protein
MEDCIFCKIIAGDIPGDIVYRDDEIIAFRDISPLASTHVLIIPREHIASLNDLTADNAPLLARMALVARELAVKEGIDGRGYRLVVNCGAEGGQIVNHLHMHLLGGKRLGGNFA